MKLTHFTDYSLRTLIYLAVNKERLCTVKEIAHTFQISVNHAVKVVHCLSQNEYITSKKGKNGGIALGKNPNEIKIGELVQKLEPDFDLVECFNTKNICRIENCCRFKLLLVKARNAFLETLNTQTLADIAGNKEELRLVFKK